MKRLLAIAVASAFLSFGYVPKAHGDGCYLCEGGGYVRYRGSDTFAKRKEALKKCGCKVTGTTSSCTNPKCTVSVMGLDASPLVDRLRDRFGLDVSPCDR